jgi:4-carboxymuconolactone decarboxylase
MGGPFVALLRSPEFLIRLQHLGAYLRFESVLPLHLSELVILLVARHWSQNYEWSVHAPIARDVGLGAHIVEAIAAGARPFEMPADVALVHDFCIELFLHRGVSDRLYEDAVTRFGEQGVVDLTGIAGYYTTLAMIMNVARSAPAADATDLLPPLP